MINENYAKAFCKDDISLIENYDKAIVDDTQTWHCHHRRETIFSKADLIEIGEYYNRPACELIFLTPLEHIRLHHLGKHHSAETHQKMSEAHKGKNHSDETRQKMSEAHKGKPSGMKDKHHSADTCKKIAVNNGCFWKGKHLSAETCKKIAEANKGKHWYNNGVKCIKAKTCPEGFVPGRLK